MKYNFKFSNFFIKLNYISLTFFILSVSFILVKGLNYGIDFKGGTLLEIEVESKNITTADLRSSLNNLELGDVNVKNFGKENHYLIKIEKNLNNNKSLIMEIKSELNKSLGEKINYRRIENVGPKVSSELLKSGIISICLALIAMLFYIWVRFEWQFSLGSIVALTHDVIITLGIFSILSIEINLSIVAAVLTIVGYSMNDTVVIYDRIRENLSKFNRININEISDISINETLSRTLITSVTTLLALLSIFILGGEILKGFSFAMILGVLIGTYSSIFVAAPMLKYLKVSHKTLEKKEEKIVP
jgi:preprotein translocase subunit SecF|tara:strand:+ start:1520 stop:2428 length:909 start_codon:yes stop_codon:yes gene_type:complete